ncbi:MAG: T9SS type A sorting domain-containing protein [Lewinellaceae bacterium]|nr:T9SS type A sorting domain-containing protein [Lewinellaceae bacterium]
MRYSIFSPIRLAGCFLLLLLQTAAFAQQNQKVVFPNPQGFFTYYAYKPPFILNTPDNGWLIASYMISGDDQTGLPRLIKLDGNGQAEWDNFYLEPANPGYHYLEPLSVLNAPGGGWLMSFRDDTTGMELIKIGDDGSEIWTKDIGPTPFGITMLGVVNSHYYGIVQEYAGNNNQWRLYQLDLNGNVVNSVVLPAQWTNFNSSYSVILTENDEIQAYFNLSQNGAVKTYLARYDLAGNELWNIQPAGISQGQLYQAAANGFYLLSNNTLYRYDATGNLLNQLAATDIPDVSTIRRVEPYPDGSILVSGSTVTSRGYMAKLDASYNVTWISEAPDDAQPAINSLWGIPTADGWAAGAGSTALKQVGFVRIFENAGIQVNTLSGVVKRDVDEDCLIDGGVAGLNGTRVTAGNTNGTHTAFSQADGSYLMKLPPGEFAINADPAEQFFFLCPAAANSIVSFPPGGGTASLDLPIQSLDVIHRIEGKVLIDENNNCIAEPDDRPAPYWLVNVQGGGFQVSQYTNTDGAYSIYLPDGTYEVVAYPVNPNFSVCAPVVKTVTFSSPQAQTETVDFSVEKAFDCGLMKTWVNAGFVRPCTTSTFTVYYQNVGTSDADDVKITVTLDPMLTYVSASATPLSINGNTIVFERGTVPPWANYATITIDATPDCSLTAGQLVCVTSEIEPDTVCYSSGGWSGALITVDGDCNANQSEATFKFKNIGSAASQPLDYIIVEDQIVLKSGTFSLPPGDSLMETVDVSGMTLTGSSEQEPGYPGDSTVNYSLVNCVGMPGMPGGFNGPAGPFSYQGCYEVRTSFDPNDKQARPLGFGADHIVLPGSTLEYLIRFQNTGNDTAFLVVIRDTLSQDLDPATIRLQGASHPYRFDLLGGNIVQFTFENILLPDSTTNPSGSQGYVEFGIRHRADIPLGTVIGNNAAIYFDYNQPVITNTVYRKIDRYFDVSATGSPDKGIIVKVFPNPAMENAVIELPYSLHAERLLFELYDVAGRTVQTAAFTGNRYQFERGSLAPGVYYWNITGETGALASGKVVLR